MLRQSSSQLQKYKAVHSKSAVKHTKRYDEAVHKFKKWLRECLVQQQSSVDGTQLGWRIPSVDSLKLVELACTKIENVHKVRKKTSVFIDVTVISTTTGEDGIQTRLCEPL